MNRPRFRLAELALLLLALSLPAAGEESRETHREKVFAKAAEIQELVEEIRGLEFEHPVEMNLMNRQEFRAWAERKMAQELPEGYLESYQLAYGALGLMPRDFDVMKGMLDMLEAGVAGLYDEVDKKLYVFEDIPLDGNTEITLAHELCHALEDQHFDLGALLEGAKEREDEDLEFAIRGLVEGTATALMTQYQAAAKISMMELMAGQLKMAGEQMSNMPEVPTVMTRELTLPYTAGARLVERLLGRKRDWRKIDEIMSGAMPASSEQVLHPKKFGVDQPVRLDLGDLAPIAGEGWEEIWQNTLGEMRIAAWIDTLKGRKENMLMAQLTRGYNKESSGWDGDRYAVYRRGDDLALALVTVWDREQDASEFFAGYAAVGFRRKFPGAELAVSEEGTLLRYTEGDSVYHLERDGDRVLLLEGFGAEATAELLTALYQVRAVEVE